MLYPLIRINRAIASVLICPEYPIQAIATSEISSVIIPLLNLNMHSKILSTILAMIYFPQYSSFILDIHNRRYLIYNQAEICLLLLFLLSYSLYKF